MTTKLDKPVTRELQLRHEMRQVIIRLVPGDPTTGAVEAIEFRLKGKPARFRLSTLDVFRMAQRAALTGDHK